VRVLVVEDDRRLARLIAEVLADEGFVTSTVYDAPSALEALVKGEWDVAILDRMLPGMDGAEVVRLARARGSTVPVLILTARDAVDDRVEGLESGADDYLVKPFAFAELLARVRALLRRGSRLPVRTQLQVGDLVMDLLRHEVRRGNRLIELTAREFALLEYLMRNAGFVLTRGQILGTVWGAAPDTAGNLVELYIHYLRSKIDRPGEKPLIRTVRGVGYTIKDD
jgi:DNA-binding response OmpR family regulator